MPVPMLRALVVTLLAAGIAFVLLIKLQWPSGSAEVAFAGVFAAIVALVPVVRRGATWTFDRLRSLTPRQRVHGAMIVAVVWFLSVLAANSASHRPFRLLWHDEHQFQIQTRMLASGRLWMPPHELSDSFDTFYVLITPKYAAQSFPGAALMFVPGIWLDLPPWVMPLVITSVAMGLMWWVLAEVVDPAAATVGLIAILGTVGMQGMSTKLLAQVPALLLGLVAVAGWLHYRRSRRLIWVLLIGVALGWCLITRPLDAACYIAVIGVATIGVWVRSRPKHVALAVLLGVLGATPFVALQLVFNYGITGTLTKTPFTFYNERDQPALAFGAAGDLTRRPASIVPEKQWFYDLFTMEYVDRLPRRPLGERVADRINTVLPIITPGLWALPIACIGLAGLVTARRWMVFALLPLFVIAYSRYPIYAQHYITFAIPAIALLFALSPGVIAACLPDRWAEGSAPTVAAGLLGFGLGLLYLNLPGPGIYTMHDVEDYLINAAVAPASRPAIVLFETLENTVNLHEEPVYNDDVIWPDDAPVIRAHSLPSANAKLFAYYAARQPNRRVYALNRHTLRLRPLGNVADLARQFPTTQP